MYLSFIQHKSPEIICNPRLKFLVDLTPKLYRLSHVVYVVIIPETHYFDKSLNYWGLKFLLSDIEFMNACSFTIHFKKISVCSKTRSSTSSYVCMNHGQFQPPIWHTLDHKTAQVWWLANMETNTQSCGCCVTAFVDDIWCFCPHKYTFHPHIQLVCPNILKHQF